MVLRFGNVVGSLASSLHAFLSLDQGPCLDTGDVRIFSTQKRAWKILQGCAPCVWLVVNRNGGHRKCSEHAHIPNQLPLFSLAFLARGRGLHKSKERRDTGVSCWECWDSGDGDEPSLRRGNRWVHCSAVRRGMLTGKMCVGERGCPSVYIERRIVKMAERVASSSRLWCVRWGRQAAARVGSGCVFPKKEGDIFVCAQARRKCLCT